MIHPMLDPLLIRFVSMSLLAISILTLFSGDSSGCTVRNAGMTDLNGYYIVENGLYCKVRTPVKSELFHYLPSAFDLRASKVATTNRAAIRLTKEGSWMLHLVDTDLGYKSNPTEPLNYLYTPPEDSWTVYNDPQGRLTGLHPPHVSCFGSLAEFNDLQSTSEQSNIQLLLTRPVTTAIILGLLYYAYYLWAYHIPVEDVAFSYDAVVSRKELFRIFTASIAHYDLMHIGFNIMSMWQLGGLEPVYGSLIYAYLNVDLLVLTMAICIGLYWYMMTYGGQPQIAFQQSVGWSCVLFAWMVASSVRMNQFCPIFFFPSLCFSTYTIPMLNLPINFGPFVFLIVTKFIIPRSSLIGHLSGILIGYPLAWNLLDWLTPPIFICMCSLVYMHAEDLYVWKLPTYDASYNLSDFITFAQMTKYKVLKLELVVTIVVAVCIILLFGLDEICFRTILLYLIWSAVQARRIEMLSDQLHAQTSAGYIMLLSMLIYIIALAVDCASLGCLLANWSQLSSSDGSTMFIGVVVLSVSIITGLAYVFTALSCLHEMSASKHVLQELHLYSPSLHIYLDRLLVHTSSEVPVVETAAFEVEGDFISRSSSSSYLPVPVRQPLDIELIATNEAEQGQHDSLDDATTSSSRQAARQAAAEAAIARYGGTTGDRGKDRGNNHSKSVSVKSSSGVPMSTTGDRSEGGHHSTII